eukprot:5282927-Pyramimonas_sp.AAC.1
MHLEGSKFFEERKFSERSICRAMPPPQTPRLPMHIQVKGYEAPTAVPTLLPCPRAGGVAKRFETVIKILQYP